MVESLSDAGLVPLLKPARAGHPTAAAYLTRQIFPRQANQEHKDDAAEQIMVREARPTAACLGVFMAA
jgi:hypothetical protein